ncbi:MAG TPA: AsnC family transcriptional regulator [Rhodoblastus sp.]|nr:AsnC family transcriptional regulator [Rhodoblastus sp.]
MIDETDRRIVNALQDGFPLAARPFAIKARELGIGEDELIARVAHLRASGLVTRFGPFLNAENIGGDFCLCAMAVPPEKWAAMVDLINAQREVAHNYRREHRLNMWFVLAVEDRGEIAAVARRIETASGLEVLLFPKEREYFLDMRIPA